MNTIDCSVGQKAVKGIQCERGIVFPFLFYKKLYAGITFPDTHGPNGTTAICDGVKTELDFIFCIAVELTVFIINCIIQCQLLCIFVRAGTVALKLLTS